MKTNVYRRASSNKFSWSTESWDANFLSDLSKPTHVSPSPYPLTYLPASLSLSSLLGYVGAHSFISVLVRCYTCECVNGVVVAATCLLLMQSPPFLPYTESHTPTASYFSSCHRGDCSVIVVIVLALRCCVVTPALLPLSHITYTLLSPFTTFAYTYMTSSPPV